MKQGEKREKVSQKKQALVAILDNQKMSSKELCKYLNIPKNTAYSLVYMLKKEGLIEHVGFDRYALTDKGRIEVGEIIGAANKPKEELAKIEKEIEVLEKEEEKILDELGDTGEDIIHTQQTEGVGEDKLSPLQVEAFSQLSKITDFLFSSIRG